MKLFNKLLSPVIFGVTLLLILIYLFNYDSKNLGTSTEIGLQFSYILIYLSLAAILFGFVLSAVEDPQSMVKSLIGLGVIVVISLIAYGMATNEVTELYKKFYITPFLSQMIGGGLILSALMMGISVLAIVYSEVMNAIK